MTARAKVVVFATAIFLGVPISAADPLAQDDPALIATLLDLAEAIDGEGGVYGCIDTITKEFPTQYRLMNTPSHDLFVAKYGRVFEERLGLKGQVVHFDEGGAAPVPGQPAPKQGGDNILGVMPGSDLTKWVVVGGHYDTRELTAGGGAYDNTSGICTVLELAKAMVSLDIQPKATIVFAWWDGEEWGLFGSRAFLKDHSATKELLGLPKETPIEFVLAQSFDMVGLNYPAMNTWVRYGDPATVLETAILNLRTAPIDPEKFTLCPSYGCYKYETYTTVQLEAFVDYQALVREVAHGLLGSPPELVQVYDDQYGRSDHVPFIAAGIPGMRIQGSHDEEYPHYHQPSDTLEAMIELAGDEAMLRRGFDQAADVGGLVAAYGALTGGVGTYGAAAQDSPTPAPSATPMKTPGPALMGLVAALALAFAARRRI